jgi:DNA-nicking Smr family endonuclease
MDPNDLQPPELVELEITDTLDLHSFPPRDIPEIVESFLEAATEKGLRHLRIIHGKGIGVQRRRVRELLARHPAVVSFADAHDAGSWGATTVELRSGPLSE